MCVYVELSCPTRTETMNDATLMLWGDAPAAAAAVVALKFHLIMTWQCRTTKQPTVVLQKGTFINYADFFWTHFCFLKLFVVLNSLKGLTKMFKSSVLLGDWTKWMRLPCSHNTKLVHTWKDKTYFITIFKESYMYFKEKLKFYKLLFMNALLVSSAIANSVPQILAHSRSP